jgi:ABC-type uncharacterized transport system permease subunit
MIGYDGNNHVLGTRIHVIVAGITSLLINVLLGPANEHDSMKLFPLMKGISIATGAHRSRKKTKKDVFADAAYDTFLVRFFLSRRGKIKALIPK